MARIAKSVMDMYQQDLPILDINAPKLVSYNSINKKTHRAIIPRIMALYILVQCQNIRSNILTKSPRVKALSSKSFLPK